MHDDIRKYGLKDTLVTIEVDVTDTVDGEELKDIKQDIFLFVMSIGGSFLKSPLDDEKRSRKILAVFESNHHQTEEIERYFYEDQSFQQFFDASLVMHSIEPVTPSYVKEVENKSYK